jgi:hypothetical protein
MPGENLNSLQFISSENILKEVDPRPTTPPKYTYKGKGLKSSGKFNKSSYDLLSGRDLTPKAVP